MSFGVTELILVLVIVLLLFGIGGADGVINGLCVVCVVTSGWK